VLIEIINSFSGSSECHRNGDGFEARMGMMAVCEEDRHFSEVRISDCSRIFEMRVTLPGFVSLFVQNENETL
jgi:hypothetical protein